VKIVLIINFSIMNLKIVKQALLSFAIMSGLLLVLGVAPMTGFAQITAEAPSGILNQTGGEGNIKTLVNTLVNFALGFLGFICVLFIIYAGFLLVTSNGSEEKLGEAKKIILYCLLGIIVIFASYAIVNTVLGAPTGATTTTTTTTQ
jgi:type IV secretory pathway VirB2 component (pilin)